MKIELLICLIFFGCSSSQMAKDSPKRFPTSNSYQCHFSKIIDGKNVDVNLKLDELVLKINQDEVLLKESDFSTGGFVYKEEKSEQDWKIKIDFKTYKKVPTISMIIDKSPLNKKLVIDNQKCN